MILLHFIPTTTLWNRLGQQSPKWRLLQQPNVSPALPMLTLPLGSKVTAAPSGTAVSCASPEWGVLSLMSRKSEAVGYGNTWGL